MGGAGRHERLRGKAMAHVDVQERLFDHGQQGPGSDEYWTPPELFDRLGVTFDLDVAAPLGGVPWVPALRHYSAADDGLSQPWGGRVWMNPPYSNCSPWVRRWMRHGDGVAIVPAARALWFGELWAADEVALCLPADLSTGGLFRFIGRDGKRKNVFMPVVVAAIGERNIDALSGAGLGPLRIVPPQPPA